jgi:alkylation response protein AidB-like acyl-CoA dehydrogenase
VTVRPFRQITGSMEFAEVFFDAARIPASLRIGDAGAGWQIAMRTVTYERGPADIGFTADFQRTVRNLAQARRDGMLRDDPALVAQVARSHVDVEVLRLHVLRSLSRRSRGEGGDEETSVDKLLMTRTEQALAQGALQLLGSRVLLGGDPAALHSYLWSRAASVYGGSSQIQRTIVATRLLGLPRT